jgi:hypothetical protein
MNSGIAAPSSPAIGLWQDKDEWITVESPAQLKFYSLHDIIPVKEKQPE